MTHHDKGEQAKEQEKAIRDQADADQETVKIPESELEELGEEEGGKKGKKSTKGHTELGRIKDQVTCGFCGINMAVGGTPTVVPVKGKRVPKDAKGQYRFRSPGAESDNTLAGVLCEKCARNAELFPGSVDIKTVIAVEKDGNVYNIPVKNL